jgi:Flp pilus assembly protein TadG
MRTVHERLRQRARSLVPARWRAERGQSILEMAIFMPLLLIFGLACMQFAILFIAYINVANVTRDAARWVAIHPNVIDGNVDGSTANSTFKTIKDRLPSGLTKSALTLSITPACASLSGGKCTGRDPGTRLIVSSTYTITQHLFLPTSFGWGSMSVAIPTTLPTYTINMQVEPQ